MYLALLYHFVDQFCMILAEFMAIDDVSKSMLLKARLEYLFDLPLPRVVTLSVAGFEIARA